MHEKVNVSVDEDYRAGFGDELLAGRGVRDRLDDASVATRAGPVVSAIHGPSDELDAFVAARAMTAGTDWCTNLRGGADIGCGRAQPSPISPLTCSAAARPSAGSA